MTGHAPPPGRRGDGTSISVNTDLQAMHRHWPEGSVVMSPLHSGHVQSSARILGRYVPHVQCTEH